MTIKIGILQQNSAKIPVFKRIFEAFSWLIVLKRAKLLLFSKKEMAREFYADCFFALPCSYKYEIVDTAYGHTTYIWNIMFQKCEGNCGRWVLNKIFFKNHTENMKKMSWEPFGSCLLNSTANPAQFRWKWVKLAVLFSRQWLPQFFQISSTIFFSTMYLIKNN